MRKNNIQNKTEYYHFTANGNLQAYMYENLLYVHYGYNDANTRTYKYSFDLSPQWVNGRLEAVNFNLHNAMFYPNAYINFNNDGHYTKHYYNGMERIASRLGDQNLQIHTHAPELQDRKDQLDTNIRRNIVEITGYNFLSDGEEPDPDNPKPHYDLPHIGVAGLQPSADGLYYYHTNHLGSTSFVTDENASVVHGFLYAPFGEITNEYNSSFGSSVLPKYSFNAKELDEETGMYYYEARYYQPPVFVSRDRLFEKYPFMSPYGYCMNNPIKYIDPSGDSVKFAGNKEEECYNKYKSEVSNRRAYWQDKVSKNQASLGNAKTKLGKMIFNYRLNSAKSSFKLYDGIQKELNDMENSPIVFRIRMGKNIIFRAADADGSTTYNINTNEVDINIHPEDDAMPVIAHELLHGYQYLNGDLDFNASGIGGGYFYDQTDEIAAFERQDLFGDRVNPIEMVNKHYSKLSKESKSYNKLTPIEKLQYNRQKELGTYR